MTWGMEYTSFKGPAAVLRERQKVIAKVYLSPDEKVLRIVLPELQDKAQLDLKIISDTDGAIIDFRRLP